MKTIMTTAILMISWTFVGKWVFSLSVPQRVFSLRTGAPRSFRRKSDARTRILHYGLRPRPYCEVFWPPTPHIPQSIRRDLSHDQRNEAPRREETSRTCHRDEAGNRLPPVSQRSPAQETIERAFLCGPFSTKSRRKDLQAPRRVRGER